MKKFFATLLMAVLFTPQMMADEGMWLLQLMRQQNLEDQMRKQGLRISVDDIYSPDAPSLKDAIGIFGGGCTGEVISPKGLVITNHHCGFSFIQQLSTVEHNYLHNGFWSQSYEEELPCEDIAFTFVVKITDVTDEVNKQVKEGKISEEQSFDRRILNNIGLQLFKADNIEGKEYMYPQLLPYFEGNKFYLVYYKKYTDVRLVATPPNSIGKFGGETDNWMWPRHTGDFSVFRIYADKNGNPAAYSKDNVPLSTPKYLNVALTGFEDGDFAMIMGFPGSTSRYLTGEEVKQRMYHQNEPRIAMRDVTLKIIREEMAKSEDIAIKYANKQARISNYWKNSIGMNKAIVDNKVVETKLAEEAEFKAWAQKNGKNEYVDVVEKINACVEEMNRTQYLTTVTSELIMNVEFIYRNLTKENGKLLEKPETLEETMKNIYNWLHERDYNHDIDRRIAKEVLPLYFELTKPEERNDYLNEVYAKYKGNLEKYIDHVYENSILANEANLKKFLKKPTLKKFEKDPAVLLRTAVFESYSKLSAKNAEFAQVMNPLHKTYLKGLMEKANGAPVYPDANFTMRLTYGNVKSYQPKDGVTFNYYTTLKGVMEKEDPNNSEFIVPARLKELYEAKDYGRYAMANGEMPVAFLTTNDITGGNSGSGILNADGELIGLAFDGNWESLSGDINFDDNLQRCINVDIRYVLFVIEKLGNCKRLIDEMTIVTKAVPCTVAIPALK
ncbi:MAG: S46 family peptidase [Bacteroidaceae bacterium]|nr:S46 family peptidase [Bacteroidaceae bacterium]